MANDRFLIRKRTLCATASNDGTWPNSAYRTATLLHSAASQLKK
jgi:hypothetical protein